MHPIRFCNICVRYYTVRDPPSVLNILKSLSLTAKLKVGAERRTATNTKVSIVKDC